MLILPTKLSRYAEGVMEAVWLAAIIITPLFFNKYSSRIFEPDKATLLRTLALIMLLAWFVKLLDVYFAGRKTSTGCKGFKSLFKIPFVLPVTSLGLIFLIATIFSVTPRISFWGSYQRLQGFYTTFAYLVLFAVMVGNINRHEQVERLITTAILTSLPVSLYGILQHYGIDPIPWGGDVTRRVASNMGNPIFVAAFLILVFPLSVGRIVDSFQKILREIEDLGIQTARATVYIFIAALQLIAIFFSQSRGPWLGLFAGGFILFVLLAMHWRKKWLTLTVILLAFLAAGFLVILNIPDSPLTSLQTMPTFHRLGELLNSQSRTARVRSLIWGGAAEMVMPHEPIEYPDGKKDPFNILRPLIGYGPETMHMAYNPFYPPELAYVESRNASPDRSHNETWDTLVFTGILGFLASLSVFTSVFFYGFKWLGLIQNYRQKYIFFFIFFGSGIISAFIFARWQGIAFAGLGLPFGLILGLIIYLAIIALFTKDKNTSDVKGENETRDLSHSLSLIIFLSAIVAHFAEINFGIAIVSTRTYFFAYSAMILSLGYLLPNRQSETIPASSTNLKPNIQKTILRKKNKRSRKTRVENADWLKAVLTGGLIGGLLLLPMNFEYISNLWGLTSVSKILWTSLTQVEQNVVSYGVLALILTTWVSAVVILVSEVDVVILNSRFWKTFVAILGLSALISFFYGTWLSGSLARIAKMAPRDIQGVITQTGNLEGLLTQFYAYLILLLLVLGIFLSEKSYTRSGKGNILTSLFAVVGFILIIWLSIHTNLHIIQADIAFKMAEPFANSQQWAVANTIYRRAIELSPDEDYYYLFLGRGLLEEAKMINDPIEQEQAFRTAEKDLLTAQSINPLNPDHTANLARLYSWWALQAEDDINRQERGNVSNQYYKQVTMLSPNNARLWDEWAILHLNVLNDSERALELLQHSIEIDPKYDWTHALLGDYYNQRAQNTEDSATRNDLYTQAIFHYQQAIQLAPKSLNYYFALASVYQALNDIELVISTLEDSLEFAPYSDIWKIEDNLTHYYYQLEEYALALLHAQRALQSAPESEIERIQTIISQLQSLP